MSDTEHDSFEEEIFNRLFSEEYRAEQTRLHKQMDEYLKRHYNYEHDEAEVQRLLGNVNPKDQEDQNQIQQDDVEFENMWQGLCSISPVRIIVHERTPGVLKRKH